MRDNQGNFLMTKVVLLRHGESIWNKDNLFTGWADVDLSENGKIEAARAGELLKSEGFSFDVAFGSVLKRAIRTLWITLDVLDLMWIPVEYSWRLNERHYGALQGLNKAGTAAKYGEEQVLIWRRSYDIRPPALEKSNPQYPGRDARYRGLMESELPLSECLKDTVARFLPYWHQTIVPSIQSGKRPIIAAHGNSLRASLNISMVSPTRTYFHSTSRLVFPWSMSSTASSSPSDAIILVIPRRSPRQWQWWLTKVGPSDCQVCKSSSIAPRLRTRYK